MKMGIGSQCGFLLDDVEMSENLGRLRLPGRDGRLVTGMFKDVVSGTERVGVGISETPGSSVGSSIGSSIVEVSS